MKLSEKFEEALIYATRAHANQTRKKTGIPFVAHILGVTAIALEYGANETALTSSISRTRMVRHGWYQRRISCTTRVRFWLSFDDMASKCSSGSVEKKMAPFGITEPL